MLPDSACIEKEKSKTHHYKLMMKIIIITSGGINHKVESNLIEISFMEKIKKEKN